MSIIDQQKFNQIRDVFMMARKNGLSIDAAKRHATRKAKSLQVDDPKKYIAIIVQMVEGDEGES